MTQVKKGFQSFMACLENKLPILGLAFLYDSSDAYAGWGRIDLLRVEQKHHNFLGLKWKTTHNVYVGKIVSPGNFNYWPAKHITEGDRLNIVVSQPDALPQLESLAEKLHETGFPTQIIY